MTELFPPENYAGTIGATLDPAAVTTVGGSLSPGSGTATYQDFGDGTTWARYLGQKALYRDSNSAYGQHFWIAYEFALNHQPTGGFVGHQLLNILSGNNVASINYGTAGSVSIQGADGRNVDVSRARFDFRTGTFVAVWEVNTQSGIQTLSLYSTTGLLLDQLTGACGTETTTRYREGVNTPGIADAQLFVRTLGVTDAFVAPIFGISSIWVCNIIPKPDRLDVTTVTIGADQVRLYFPDLDQLTEAQVPLQPWGAAYHFIDGLQPQIRYSYEVQGLSHGVWTTIDAGSNKTLPASLPGVPQSLRVGSLGCTSSNSTASGAWDHALASDLSYVWHEGDWDYDNDESNDPAIYFYDYISQMLGTPGLAAVCRFYGLYPTPSDHIWENNANTGGMQSTLAHDAAWRLLWPQYESPLVDEQGLCWSFDVGNGIRHVFWDFRNYYRWDSDDPQVPYNSSQRAACGPKQLAWMQQQITDPSVRFVFFHSDPVPLSNPPHTPPYPTELDGKTDALPSYTAFRDQLFSWLASKPSLYFFGDYHSLSACSRSFSPLNHVAIFGAAGTDQTFTYRNNAANGAAIVGVYEQYWPPEASNNNLPIGVWGYVDLVDDSSSITINCRGWDVLTTPGTPIERVSLTEIFVVGYEQFTLAGTVTDPVTGQPANGFLTLTPCDGDGNLVSPIVDAGGQTVLAGGPSQVAFSNGQVSVVGLPNPGDTNLNPTGFGYKLQITTDSGGLLPEVIFTVAAGVELVNLASLQPGAPVVVINPPGGRVIEFSTTPPTDTSHGWVDLTS